MSRRQWFASMLEASAELGVLGPEGIVRDEPGALLVRNLPADLVIAVLDKGLSGGKLTPHVVVETVGIAALGVHLPENTLWDAIVDAGAAAGLTEEGAADGKVGEFLTRAVRAGFETDQLTAEALLTHATPAVLASNLPPDLAAKLLQASLEKGAMSPGLIVEALGVDALSKHLPQAALWACVCDVAASGADGSEELYAELDMEDLGDPEDTQHEEETLAGELGLDDIELEDSEGFADPEPSIDLDESVEDDDSELAVLSDSPNADSDEAAAKRTASGAGPRLRSGLMGRRFPRSVK